MLVPVAGAAGPILERVGREAASMAPGDPLLEDSAMGPVIREESRARVLRYVEEGVRQGATIVRAYATYEPLKTFFYLAVPFLLLAAVLFARLLIIFLTRDFSLPGNVQSLIVAVMALIVGFLVMIFGLLADRIGDSRRLMEEILYRLRRDEVTRYAASQMAEESDHPRPQA